MSKSNLIRMQNGEIVDLVQSIEQGELVVVTPPFSYTLAPMSNVLKLADGRLVDFMQSIISKKLVEVDSIPQTYTLAPKSDIVRMLDGSNASFINTLINALQNTQQPPEPEQPPISKPVTTQIIFEVNNDNDMQEALNQVESGTSEEIKEYVLNIVDDFTISSNSLTLLKNLEVEYVKIVLKTADGYTPCTISSGAAISFLMSSIFCEIEIKNLNFNFTGSTQRTKRIIANGNKITFDNYNLGSGKYSEVVGCFDILHNGGVFMPEKNSSNITLINTELGNLTLTSVGDTNHDYDSAELTLGANVVFNNYSISIGYAGSGNTLKSCKVIIKEMADVQAGEPGKTLGGLFGTTANNLSGGSTAAQEVEFDIKGSLSGIGNNDIDDNAIITGFIDINKIGSIKSGLFNGRRLTNLTIIADTNTLTDKVSTTLGGANIVEDVNIKLI